MIENEARAMYYKHQMKVQIHSLGGIDDLTMAEKMELEKMIENEFQRLMSVYKHLGNDRVSDLSQDQLDDLIEELSKQYEL